MTRVALALVTAALTGAVVAAGCGVGEGQAAQGEASLRVTRAFGEIELVDATLEDPTESDTVVRFLDDNADIETSYGGNFVDSIDGLAGSTVNGGSLDWFFFVNGYYSDVGAGEAKVRPGDRIWWDLRKWSQAYRVPAVVGSWPEPFLSGFGGERFDVVVECVDGAAPEVCEEVAERLRDAGVEPAAETVARPMPHPDDLRVLVGAWSSLRDDPAAAQLEQGPAVSGVYADLVPCDVGYRLEVLGSDGQPREQLTSAGFVAAVRKGDEQPTWVVSATGDDALPSAAELLEADTLRDRYAVAAGSDGEPLPIPAPDELPLDEEVVCG